MDNTNNNISFKTYPVIEDKEREVLKKYNAQLAYRLYTSSFFRVRLWNTAEGVPEHSGGMSESEVWNSRRL